MADSKRLPMARGFGRTERFDNWWKGPLVTALFLGTCTVYATWRGFMEADFWIFSDFGRSAGNQTLAIENKGSHVLSPLFSPLIIPGKDGLGSFVPDWLNWMSPAMFILIFPAGFRMTCYYYRKAYYRSWLSNPVACAVSTPFDEYSGERRIFLFQNLHRYFMYAAVIYLFILSYDVLISMKYHDTTGSAYGLSVGTIVLALNVLLLGGYTLGCHSFRHAIGGLTKTMAEAMAIFAPNINSYRRLQPEMFAPVEPNWGPNHRNVALRIPISDEKNLRFEHRTSGADANPFLVTAARLSLNLTICQ